MIRSLLIGIALLSASITASAASEFELDLSRLHNSAVHYQSHAKITEFPMPVIMVKRAGLSAGSAEFNEIKNNIIYPLINSSNVAIAGIIVEWYPGQSNTLGISILWVNGEQRESLLPRISGGHYINDAYRLLLDKPAP